MMKRVLSVGKFKCPDDSNKPYYVEIEFFVGGESLIQEVDEKTFFTLIKKIITTYKPEIIVNVS